MLKTVTKLTADISNQTTEVIIGSGPTDMHVKSEIVTNIDVTLPTSVLRYLGKDGKDLINVLEKRFPNAKGNITVKGTDSYEDEETRKKNNFNYDIKVKTDKEDLNKTNVAPHDIPQN